MTTAKRHPLFGKRGVKNLLEYLLFLLIAIPARLLPRNLALRLGELLGRMACYLLPGRRRTTRDNLQQAFPDFTAKDLDRAVSGTFAHIGISGLEMLRLDQLDPKRDLHRLFDYQGLEHLQAAYAEERGVFLITGHVGFWEVGTFFLGLLGYPADFVAKKMKNPLIDEYFQRMRESQGGFCLDSKGGARKILRSLGQKRGVCVLMDQRISHREGEAVNFFGRTAYTTPIIAQMALKHRVPIVPVFSHRLPDLRYRVTVEPPLPLAASADPAEVAALTQAITDRIEQAVRQDLHQWLWLHRRWRG